ncbi:MAG: aminopeptidase [Chloroflexi bacterium]|nr:aminopeptidase [Chloroflexota bacterium]
MMKTKLWLSMVGVLLAVGVLGYSASANSTQPAVGVKTSAGAAADVDYKALAKQLVTQSAPVKEGDLVLIASSTRDMPLAEELAVAARQLGAHPLIWYNSQQLDYRLITDVPDKYDPQFWEFEFRLSMLPDVLFRIDYGDNNDLFADVPPERFDGLDATYDAIGKADDTRRLPRVFVGNGLYPTADTAAEYGLTQDELSKIFWAGLNVDYTKLQATGAAVKEILANGKEAHITHPNGTDLMVSIEARPVFVNDGVISDEDIATGGVGTKAWLPAGDAYLTPVPGTAEGKIVGNYNNFDGQQIEGLTLTFKAGNLTAMTAKSGLERLKEVYDAAGKGKEQFGALDLGINPNVVWPDKALKGTYVSAGAVTIAFGGNDFYGGENSSDFSYDMFLPPGATVEIDGKVLVDKGVLKP